MFTRDLEEFEQIEGGIHLSIEDHTGLINAYKAQRRAYTRDELLQYIYELLKKS